MPPRRLSRTSIESENSQGATMQNRPLVDLNSLDQVQRNEFDRVREFIDSHPNFDINESVYDAWIARQDNLVLALLSLGHHRNVIAGICTSRRLWPEGAAMYPFLRGCIHGDVSDVKLTELWRQANLMYQAMPYRDSRMRTLRRFIRSISPNLELTNPGYQGHQDANSNNARSLQSSSDTNTQSSRRTRVSNTNSWEPAHVRQARRWQEERGPIQVNVSNLSNSERLDFEDIRANIQEHPHIDTGDDIVRAWEEGQEALFVALLSLEQHDMGILDDFMISRREWPAGEAMYPFLRALVTSWGDLNDDNLRDTYLTAVVGPMEEGQRLDESRVMILRNFIYSINPNIVLPQSSDYIPRSYHYSDSQSERRTSNNNSNGSNNNNGNRRYAINDTNVNANLNRSSFNWALNADEEDTFPTVCETLVTDVDPIFNEFSRKIAKVCASVTKEMSFKIKSTNFTPQTLTISQADPENPLNSLVKAIRNVDMKKLPFRLDDITVTYKGQEGIGPGVARDFISGCIIQVTSELLECVADGSDFYNIKRDLDLTNANIKRKLVTFGYLLAIMMANLIAFPFKLKKSLLHMCLYNTPPSQDVSYLVYEMMEDPESTQFIKNLLKKPKDIVASNLDFDDVGRQPKPVTIANFTSYLRNWVQHYHIPKGCKYVAEGFYAKTLAGDVFGRLHADVHAMFTILCKSKLDTKGLSKFINEQVSFTSDVPSKIQKWFKAILQKSDADFIRNILHFWSGLYTPMDGVNYQVTMGDKVFTQKVCPLPESHTCYTQLVLPLNIPSKEKFKEILETAIGSVAKGVLMTGGGVR